MKNPAGATPARTRPGRNKPRFFRLQDYSGWRTMIAEKKGKGSEAAKTANAKAAKEGKSNPRKSSAAQAELGKKGASEKTKK